MSEEASRQGLYIGNGTFSQNECFVTNALRMGFASLEENEMIKALSILNKVTG
jgi:GntR family transcriptional regulator/MocR family aminotransferase